MNTRYIINTTPVAHESAVIQGEKYRFTVLTSRLLRVEYNENGNFENRATQTVINRCFPVPEFSVAWNGDVLIITTENIELTYDTKQPFSKTSLKVRYVGKNSNVKAGGKSIVWSFGDENADNLKGTARTLDRVDGACSLEDGLMSIGSVTAMDDSETLIICDDGRIEPRQEKAVDQYLFCYGDTNKRFDYRACLKDFYSLTGKTPMLPRFALGNWWSRHHEYTQQEYTDLMNRFKKEEIPFSVAVIDMDWHYVKIDSKYGSGWTGYTWNEELFPDHKGFLKFLNTEGLVPSLNLHPQEGVAAHEDAYPQMAKAMGIDPETEKVVPFEIENPEYIENYFKYLHHPLEEEGVRFWWMDWQQGNTTSVPGLDPLWMLNHYHYLDNRKNGERGLLFSRYAGPGSHRYPIGFSGDTYISWESLDFQPYFTATASNVGYGWWSHDIGGHIDGYRSEELTTRWVQLGAFSPINRLHSAKSAFLGKEPWKYNKINEISMKRFLKLRHELIPYLYTMNYRSSELGEPIVQPIYYEYPEYVAYDYKNEYLFGTEMLVSPITKPCDDKTQMGSVKTYIPEGIWYDFFNNRRYSGGRTLTMFRDLYEMPVLVRAGGIVPMAKLNHINDVENPESLLVKVFTGESNTFELYEDDGNTESYKNGKNVITKMELCWDEKPVFIIDKPIGELSLIPKERSFDIEFIGIENCSNLVVTVDGNPIEFNSKYSDGVLVISLSKIVGKIEIHFKDSVISHKNNITGRLCEIIEHLDNFDNITKGKMYNIITQNNDFKFVLSELLQLDIDKNVMLSLNEIIAAE